MNIESLKSGRVRRTYSPQFKAEMVAQCLQGTISLASLAIVQGMNPNALRRWLTEHERYGHHSLNDDELPVYKPTTLAVSTTHATAPFIPVPITPAVIPPNTEAIRLELTRGTTKVSVSWPTSAAAQCVDLLREWLR